MNFITYIYFNPLKPSAIHECGFEPFYVGQGKQGRQLEHMRAKNLEAYNRHKNNTIKKILKAGQQPLILIVFQSDDQDLTKAEEVRLIALYGRADLKLGPLTNMTDGGDGQSGAIFSESHKSKLAIKTSEAHAAGKLAKNTEAWSKAGLEKAYTPEARAKSAKSRTGLKRGPETCKAIKNARMVYLATLSEDERKRILSTMSGKTHSQSSIDKIRANNPRTLKVEVFGIHYASLNFAVKGTGINKPKLRLEPSFKIL